MKVINVDGVKWAVEANQSVSEDNFVKLYINEVGIYPLLNAKAKEKTLREAHKLMNPVKKGARTETPKPAPVDPIVTTPVVVPDPPTEVKE